MEQLFCSQLSSDAHGRIRYNKSFFDKVKDVFSGG